MGDTTTNDYSAMVHTLLFSLDDPNPKVTTLTIEAFALLHHQMGDTRLRPLLLDHSILAAHLSTLTHRFASPVCPLPYVGRDGVLKILDRRGSSINNNNNKIRTSAAVPPHYNDHKPFRHAYTPVTHNAPHTHTQTHRHNVYVRVHTRVYNDDEIIIILLMGINLVCTAHTTTHTPSPQTHSQTCALHVHIHAHTNERVQTQW